MRDIELPQYKFRSRPLVIVGLGSNSDIMSYLFKEEQFDISYTVSRDHLYKYKDRDEVVFPLECLEEHFKPNECYVFVAIGYDKLNHTRARIYEDLKSRGYEFASYIHHKAVVYPNVEYGENVFIFENNVIQYKVKIGNNVILWSGNHVGHETVIEDHSYLSSHCVIAGHCIIGKYSFLGINSSIINNVKVGENNLIAAHTVVTSSTKDDKVVVHNEPSNFRFSFDHLSPEAKAMFDFREL